MCLALTLAFQVFFPGFPHLSPGEAWMALFSPESFGLTGLV